MNKVIFTILAIFLCLQLFSNGEQEDILKLSELLKQKKVNEALALAEKKLQKKPNHTLWMRAKSFVYLEMNKFDEAIETAKQLDKLEKEKNMSTSQLLAMIYLKHKNKNQALKWLEETVDRGYSHFEELQLAPEYQLIRREKRFKAIIEKAKQNIGIGRPAKNFRAKSITGNVVNLSDLKGKVVLLKFWATWCPPCVKSLPQFKKYYNKFRSKGLIFIGVSMDYSRAELNKILEKEKIEWPIIYSGKGKDDPICLLYNVNSAPSYWLIDREGVLRYCGIKTDELKNKMTELLTQ